MGRTESIRRQLARVGLRVICLACRATGRWYAASGVLDMTKDLPRGDYVRVREGARLREISCARCGRPYVRGLYWVEEHPELAAEVTRKARGVARATE